MNKTMDQKSDSKHFDLKKYESNLQNLADKELIDHLRILLVREKKLGDAILLNLGEINSRKIYAGLGYPSLFEMLVKHFGLSATAAFQRVNALKLIQAIPEAQEALFKGEINLSTMAATQSFIRKTELENKQALSPDEKKDIFESIKCKTLKEAQVALAELNPVAALPETKEKALSAKHTLLQIVVEQETLDLVAKIKNLLSHEIPSGNLNEILKRMAQMSLELLEKKKGRDAPKKKTSRENFTPQENKSQSEKRTRHIPIETRRRVFRRANDCCEFVNAEGKSCKNNHQLEVDHIVPWSQGGTNDEINLQVLCRTHNSYRVKETHGFFFNACQSE